MRPCRGGYALAVDAVRRLWASLTQAPDYPATPADLRTVDVVGLRLPVRASVAIAVVTLALLFDYSRTFFPAGVPTDRSAQGMFATALERFVLFGLIPFGVVVLGFRDRPGRYGLTLGGCRRPGGCRTLVAFCPRRAAHCFWIHALHRPQSVQPSMSSRAAVN